MLSASRLDLDFILNGSNEVRGCVRVDIERPVWKFLKFKGPEQLGCHPPHASLSQMNARAHTPTSAVTVVMYSLNMLAVLVLHKLGQGLISIFPVRTDCIFVRQIDVVFESVRVEFVVVWILVAVLMDGPCCKPDRAVLWEKHSLVPIIYDCSVETVRRKKCCISYPGIICVVARDLN
jgi:hypothetical protein